VNLFVWPARNGGDRAFAKDGFAVTEWSRNGLRFAAVSDIPAAELRQFETLFVKRSS
jgi:anti-sigma factor RsiW